MIPYTDIYAIIWQMNWFYELENITHQLYMQSNKLNKQAPIIAYICTVYENIYNYSFLKYTKTIKMVQKKEIVDIITSVI